MHISPSPASCSTQSAVISFSSPISKRRLYSCTANNAPRNPLRNVCSKIRSAWGDVREFIGRPSEIRRLRNTLPIQLTLADTATVQTLMKHLLTSGEGKLYEQLHLNLTILQLKQQQAQADRDIADLQKNRDTHAGRIAELKQKVEDLKQLVLSPEEETLLQQTLENLQQIASLLKTAVVSPEKITTSDLKNAHQLLVAELDKTPATMAFTQTRKILTTAHNALEMLPSLLEAQRAGQKTPFSPMVQQARETLSSLANLPAAIARDREEVQKIDQQIASEEAALQRLSERQQTAELFASQTGKVLDKFQDQLSDRAKIDY